MASFCNFFFATASCRSQISAGNNNNNSFSQFASIASHPFPMRFAVPFPSSRLASSIRASVKLTTDTDDESLNSSSFTWDVFSIPHSGNGAIHATPSNYLQGYFDKVQFCNRGSEYQSAFLPFVIEDQIVGYIHNGFADKLRNFRDVFIFPKDKLYGSHFYGYISFNSMLKTPDQRTSAVGDVVKCLGEEWIPGIRNELYPVTSSFGAHAFFSLERAAAPLFGIKAYEVHINGYVERNGQKYLWIGKRSQRKPTYPGMLDHLAAGGLPQKIDCKENLVKECEEEAGIPRSISIGAIPVGAISYIDIDGYRYRRDVVFCYDLRLPENFEPKNGDGEVDGFKLIPVKQVAEVIRKTHLFKPNCALVIIDFLFRHGYINPECPRYLDLLRSLRIGDCS